MNLAEELGHDGKEPQGPCSAWPEERHYTLMAKAANKQLRILTDASGKKTYELIRDSNSSTVTHEKRVTASAGKMAKGLFKTAAQAISHGKVSAEIRNERYDTCKACPFFIEDSKRCSECGCFMEAKTWIGGDPNALCPKQKWSR